MELGAKIFLRAFFIWPRRNLRTLFQIGGRCCTSEYLEHLLFGWRIKDIAGCEIVGVRIIGGAHALGGFGEIVGGVAELNVGAQHQPVRAGFAERHSNAASIYNSGGADLAVKLHVGVSAHDCCGGESFEDWEKAVFGGQSSEDVVFVVRGGVAEQDGAEVGDFKC